MRRSHLLMIVAITPLVLIAVDRLSENRFAPPRVNPTLNLAFSFPSRPMPPKPVHALRQVSRTEPTANVVRIVESDLSANEDRARADLRKQINRRVSDWLAETGLPRDWQAPSELVNRMIREKPETELAEDRGYGALYRASVPVDFSLSSKTLLVREYQRQMAAERLGQMAAVLGFVLACLAVVSGYIRTDEATRGYYTAPLRVVSAGALGAAGFALYLVLT